MFESVNRAGQDRVWQEVGGGDYDTIWNGV